MRSYGELALKYLGQQKKRTLLTILGLVLSTALITGTGTIILSVKKQLIKNVIEQTGHYHVAFKNIGKEEAKIIRNHMSVAQSCTGKIGGFAVIDEGEDNQNPSAPPFRLLRLYENDESAMEMLQTGKQLLEGRLPREPGEIALGKQALRALGGTAGPGTTLTLRVGKRLSLDGELITDSLYPLRDPDTGQIIPESFVITGERQFTVTGILDEEVFISNNYAHPGVAFQTPDSRNPDDTFHMLVLLSRLDRVEETALALAADAGVDPDSVVLNTKLLWLLAKGSNEEYNRAIRGFNFIVLAIIALATAAVIHNTFSISLMERISQIGVLRCVGAVPGQIRRIILREAGIICLLGIPLGIITGLLAMKIIFGLVGLFSSNFLFHGMEVILSPANLVFSALLAGGTVFTSALIPAIRAGRLSPMEAVRRSGLHEPVRKKRFGFSRAVGKGRWFFFTLAWRNIRRNPSRTTTAVLSMMISVTLFVSFGGLLRLTKETNIIHNPNLPGFRLESTTSIDKETVQEIRALEGVERVFQYRVAPATITVAEDKLSRYFREWVEKLPEFPREGDMVSLSASRILSYGDANLESLDPLIASGRIDRSYLERENGVILVQKGQFTDSRGVRSFGPTLNLTPGETLYLGEAGIPLKVAAVLREPLMDDYNENEGGIDLIVTEAQFARFIKDYPNQKLFIKIKSGASSEMLTRYLEDLTASKIQYSYVDAQKMADGFTRDFNVLALFFYGFMAVIALIGGLNVVNTISTNLFLRTGELGILQATGMDGAGLRNLILAESLLYALAALILGSFVGSALWFLLVDTVGNVRQTIYQIPWSEIGIAALGLLFIAGATGYFPLQILKKNTIIENIRREE